MKLTANRGSYFESKTILDSKKEVLGRKKNNDQRVKVTLMEMGHTSSFIPFSLNWYSFTHPYQSSLSLSLF